jgi:hypothetical protein
MVRTDALDAYINDPTAIKDQREWGSLLSLAGADLVQPIEYDAAGRLFKKYLPYAAAGNRAFQNNAVSGAASWYTANSAGLNPADLGRPYRETIFEQSPLSRVSGERAARPSEATTIGLPLWYSLGAFAENAPQVGLNVLKVGVTIPLMTLAFVLSPTSVGEGSTVNPPTVNYNIPPKVLPGFPGAKKVPRKGRPRWKTQDGDILEWDSQHGEVEVYDKRGRHKGVADPNTGQIIKNPVPGRTTDN